MSANPNNEPTIEDVKVYCEKLELETKVRNAIAEIAKKLNRTNLSAKEGIEYAELLKEAYKHLNTVENALKGQSK